MFNILQHVILKTLDLQDRRISLYKRRIIMDSESVKQRIKIGDKVTFDSDKIESFNAETGSEDNY